MAPSRANFDESARLVEAIIARTDAVQEEAFRQCMGKPTTDAALTFFAESVAHAAAAVLVIDTGIQAGLLERGINIAVPAIAAQVGGVISRPGETPADVTRNANLAALKRAAAPVEGDECACLICVVRRSLGCASFNLDDQRTAPAN